MFGQQRVPNDPEFSHTFAAFVRASWPGPGPCPPAPCLEVRTISWFPATMRIRALALLPEAGRNLDLHSTLRWAQANDMRTSLWGPFQCTRELYDSALRQGALLESGQVRYKANDVGHFGDRVNNCVHAVAGVLENPHLWVAIPNWGETGSYRVLCRMEPWLVNPSAVHAWLASALGLDQYPIIYRDWQHPRSGLVQGPVYRLFGNERTLTATYGAPAR
jgi:hypothetical protein